MLKFIFRTYSVLLIASFWHQSEAHSFGEPRTTHGEIISKCDRPNNENGTCIPISECQWYIETYTGNVNATDFWSKYNCTENLDYVCCTSNEPYQEPQKMPQKSKDTDKETRKCRRPNEMIGRCIWLNKCEVLKKLHDQLDNHTDFLNDYQCGGNPKKVCCLQNERTALKTSPNRSKSNSFKHFKDTSNAKGGDPTEFHEFPWIAVLEYKKSKDVSNVLCVGSLINERYVLTASECVEGKQIKKYGSLQSVRLGDNNTTTDPDCELIEGWETCLPSYVRRNIIHTNVNKKKKHKHGVALLRMDKMVEFSNFVKPISLPESETMMKTPINLTVAGWRSQNTVTSTQSTVLLKKRKAYTNFSDRTICAVNGIVKNSFEGDLGSPLISDKEILEGVRSNDTNCDPPSDFLSVRFNLEWIKENLDEFSPLCGGNYTEFKILNGTAVNISHYSWTVALEYKDKTNRLEVRCGGSLINKRYVLTAAHCVDKELQSVRLGANNITSHENIERKYIANKIIHKQYDGSTEDYINDIALLRLNETVILNEYFRVICLPTTDWPMKLPQRLIVVGWGNTAKSSIRRSEVLREVEVPLVERTSCDLLYGVNNNHGRLCAGGKRGEDSTKGDSGGPLMRYHKFWELEGVISYGKDDGFYPGAYTNVRYYLTWIKDNVYDSNGESESNKIPKIIYN